MDTNKLILIGAGIGLAFIFWAVYKKQFQNAEYYQQNFDENKIFD